MAAEAIVYYYEVPMAAIPGPAGTGPSVPVKIIVDTPGTYDIATYAVPAGRDVTVQLVGGGGGGGSGDGTDHGGGAGGGAGGAIVVVSAANWQLGGSLVVGAKGTGGATGPNDGTDGHDSTLTVNSIVVATCHKGVKGLGATHTGGAGGTTTTDGSVSTLIKTNGSAGTAGTTSAAGVGGKSGLTGGGAGGPGGSVAAGAGGDGQPGRATISFNP